MNPLLVTDNYKVGHPFMYPKNMQVLESNMTARSDTRFTSKGFDHKVVIAGVQGLVKEYFVKAFNEEFFNQPVEEVVEEYADIMNGVFGPGVITTLHIRKLHDLQYLPIQVQALPEGSRVNIGVPFIRIKNTVKGFGWLTNYLETLVSNALWPSVTNATIAFEFRKILQAAAIETVGEANPFVVGYQAHDFSLRGLLGGKSGSTNIGHLYSFIGSDHVPSIYYARKLYNAKNDYIAGSVPATEHSVASSNILNIVYKLQTEGSFEGTVRDESVDIKEQAEEIFIKKMITEVFPTGIFSYVSDTFDYWTVLTKILPRLKQVILDRKDTDSPAPTRLVVRPDSGDVVEMICGLRVAPDESILNSEEMRDYDVVKDCGKYYRYELNDIYSFGEYCGLELIYLEEVPEHTVRGSIEVLWDIFGGTCTEKGFKQLNSKIGLIYGDSITLKNMPEILQRLKDKGFASTNVIFGIGSFTYQYNTRDTFGQAIKATHAVFSNDDGTEYEVDLFKDPLTGDREKKSAKGRVAVFEGPDGFVLKQGATEEEQDADAFVTYFVGLPGKNFVRDDSLANVRKRLLSQL